MLSNLQMTSLQVNFNFKSSVKHFETLHTLILKIAQLITKLQKGKITFDIQNFCLKQGHLPFALGLKANNFIEQYYSYIIHRWIYFIENYF